jgi:hypothetical protein
VASGLRSAKGEIVEGSREERSGSIFEVRSVEPDGSSRPVL